MQMTGNTMLITGGNSGIGRALAEAFQALGNQVIITGRRQAALDEVVAAHPAIRALPLDIQDAGAIQRLAHLLQAEYPTLNAVIHSAGVMQSESVQADKTDVAEATIATNLLGPIRLNAALIAQLLAQPRATIMTVSSGLAFVPRADTPSYSATKAAIHAYTQALRYQLQRTPVQVLELIPPYVQTELMTPAQASDPRAMPLADFIHETMQLLTDHPDAAEIIVERVKPQRFAEASGHYDAFFNRYNDAASGQNH